MFNLFEKKFKEIFMMEKELLAKKNIFEFLKGVKTIILEYFAKIVDEVSFFWVLMQIRKG